MPSLRKSRPTSIAATFAALLLAPCILGAADSSPPPQSAGPATEALEAKMAELALPLVAERRALGLVVGARLADGSRVVRGYGLVRPSESAAPDGDTLYEIGSISKAFTGLLLADAIEDGVVKLDDPIARHLPETLELPEDEAPILLRHLASHTSGLPRLPRNLRIDPLDPYRDYDAAALYDYLDDFVLETPPGETYAYSNLGAGLLGHLLVRARGANSFDALLQARICAPLGLDATHVHPPGKSCEALAAPFGPGGVQGFPWTFDVLAGAGAIHSTAHDLLGFGERQLDPGDGPRAGAIRRSHERLFALGEEGGGVAYGWHLLGDGRTLWHNGGTGGFRSMLVVDPEAGLVVVALASTVDQGIDGVALNLRGWIREAAGGG